MQTNEELAVKKNLDQMNAWKKDSNLRIDVGTKADLVMWEQDNILDYFVSWAQNAGHKINHVQALSEWYTQKCMTHKDGAAPIDFVENKQGWKLLNQLHRLINTQAFETGFEEGLVRGRQEILEMLDKSGVAHNIDANNL